MPFKQTYLSCPKCRKVLNVRISVLGLAQGLSDFGPPTISCKKCSTKIQTGNVEWAELSRFQRTMLWAKYIIFGVIIVPSASALVTWFISFFITISFEQALVIFFIIVVSYGGAVLYAQIRKIKASIARARLIKH